MNNEKTWDEKLNIHTIGRDASHEDSAHHPYEPTPYSVLERLAKSGVITSADHVVDYGSGKGRAAIFLHDRTGCRVTGIEYYPAFVQEAEDNLKSYGRTETVRFVQADASEYLPEENQNIFFFFNPFPETILRAVLHRILESYYAMPRQITLLFCYPSDDYIGLLMTVPEIDFNDEIDIGDLFRKKDSRERIMIFTIGSEGAYRDEQ